ncbi:MAG: ABC transporter ATP-binding protein [Clostridiales bacterium]|nr:ABC transporter ATP-binding protein [Candidatus Apopatocola equi]
MKRILDVSALTIRFGGLTAIDNFSMHIDEGEFVGIIGPNGAGKTTFFNSLTGNVTPASGSVNYCGTSLIGKIPSRISQMGISRTFQNIRIFPKMTVLENVCIPLHSKPTYGLFPAVLGLKSAKAEDERIRDEALSYLERLGIGEYRDYEAGTLPYGLQRRLEIARALAAHPTLLLLDEPAAGMNNDECRELVELLKKIHRECKLTVMLIEHHMDVIQPLCDRLYVLNLGALLREGKPGEVLSDPEVVRAYLGERRKRK